LLEAKMAGIESHNHDIVEIILSFLRIFLYRLSGVVKTKFKLSRKRNIQNSFTDFAA